MIIDCPWCGKRDVREFTYQGDGTVKRPALDEPSVEAHAAYVYERENPVGPHKELWQHSGGCRCHMLVTRNTLNHEITACEEVGIWAGKIRRDGQ